MNLLNYYAADDTFGKLPEEMYSCPLTGYKINLDKTNLSFFTLMNSIFNLLFIQPGAYTHACEYWLLMWLVLLKSLGSL